MNEILLELLKRLQSDPNVRVDLRDLINKAKIIIDIDNQEDD